IAALVTTRLSGSGPERPAIDVDPRATITDVARAGRGLTELQALMTAGPDRALVAAADLRSRQVGRLGVRTLDPSVVARLPKRSEVPFLAHRWDEVVADLAIYLARWNITPGG